jgi:hypothetical protein
MAPRQADRRPREEGGDQAKQWGCSNRSLQRVVLAVLAPGDPVTFPELGARLAAYGVQVTGGESVALRQDPNAVLWSGWRPELLDAVVELVAGGQVVLARCSPARYDGAQLDLPLAPSRPSPTPLAEPCWLPVTAALAGHYRLAEPRWALVDLARVRAWSP